MLATTELPPKRHERQRHAGQRDHLGDAADDHERLEREHRGQPGGEQLREPVRRHHRGLEAAGGDQRVDRRSARTRRTGRARMTITREDEVRVRRGQDAAAVGKRLLRSAGANGPGSFSSDSPRPWPKRPPSAWANSDCWICPAPSGALLWRTGRARCRSGRGRGLIDEPISVGADEEERQPDEHVREARRWRRRAAPGRRRRTSASCRGRWMKTSISIAAPQTTSSGPKCLSGGIVTPSDPPRRDREQLALLGQVAGQEDDDADLRELGGLERRSGRGRRSGRRR